MFQGFFTEVITDKKKEKKRKKKKEQANLDFKLSLCPERISNGDNTIIMSQENLAIIHPSKKNKKFYS